MKEQRKGGFLIARVHYLAGRILAGKLKQYHLDEINPAQGRILFVLWHSDGISIRELAKKTSLEKSTLTSMLDRLEKAGYLRRVPSKRDRRIILIELTEKDRVLRDAYAKVSGEMTELFYDGFTTAEIDEFEEYLRRILDNLTAFKTKEQSTR
ncbi:MAG: MarR family transcriptional regulator [Spirochaetes bacterium]|nr:MarR family transcriptional regulator [Spirochaetota bacterium]